MDPAARVREITLMASLVNCRPTAVPTNVGPPPISPMSRGRREEGRSSPEVSGATMPNPSVPLCSANPMTKMVARPISPRAALPPMASPSPKLCSPMPTAISSDSRRAVDQPEMPRARGAASSSRAIAPGPKSPRRRNSAGGPGAEPALVEHQAAQADGEATEEQGRVPGDRADPAGSSSCSLPRALSTGSKAWTRDVPDQEDQDADGDGAEELAGSRAGPSAARRAAARSRWLLRR